jgi:hypothetical protein
VSEKIEVKPGQVWQDCDKRLRGERTLRVLRILKRAAGPDMAECDVFYRGEPFRRGLTTLIALRRFRTNSTGYRLLLNS